MHGVWELRHMDSLIDDVVRAMLALANDKEPCRRVVAQCVGQGGKRRAGGHVHRRSKFLQQSFKHFESEARVLAHAKRR